MLLEELQFTTNDGPSNASRRFAAKGKYAKSGTEIRTVLAQLTQALLGGMVRKQEFDEIKTKLEHKLGALRSNGKVSNVAAQTIVPGQVAPFGPLRRY